MTKFDSFKTNLRDLLHCINVLGEGVYVTVECYGDTIVCPPVKITKQGLYHFDTALKATVTIKYSEEHHYYTVVNDKDYSVNEKVCKMLESLEGNCLTSDYCAWFKGDDAQFI